MQTGGTPVKTALARALVIAAMERHAPDMLAAHGGTIAVSTSWTRGFMWDRMCRKVAHKQAEGRPEEDGKRDACNEGASTTTGHRRGARWAAITSLRLVTLSFRRRRPRPWPDA
eukprot:347245-Chlamydomonas_euryale.AAC.2